MKKKLILSILASSIIFAQENIEDIKLKGLNFYKNNNYQLAIDEFFKIKDYNKSSSIDFYLARCYYETGQYEKALATYERIQINEPDNKRVKLEIAQTYLMLDSYETAKIGFLELLDDSSIPDVVKSNIETRLKQIHEKNTKHFFSSTLMFGWGEDSNINNASINSYNIKIIENPLPGGDKIKSTFYETALLFNHMYIYDDILSFRNGLTFYKQDFTKDNSKQLDVISLNTSSILRNSDISYIATFGLDNVLYGDNHYLNNYSFTPKISYGINPSMIYETNLKFLNKKFVNVEDEKNNSWVYDYQNRFLTQTKDFGIFDLGLVFGKEIREEKIDYNVSKNNVSLLLGNTYQINNDYTLASNVSFTNNNYKDLNPWFDEKRKDDIYNFMLNLSYAYNKDMIIALIYNYINQDSNQTPYDYDKDILKTSVYYNF